MYHDHIDGGINSDYYDTTIQTILVIVYSSFFYAYIHRKFNYSVVDIHFYYFGCLTFSSLLVIRERDMVLHLPLVFKNCFVMVSVQR